MKRRVFVSSFVLLTMLALCVAATFGADMFSGTWKENVVGSKFGYGEPPQSNIQKIESIDYGIRMVADAVTAKGEKGHIEFTVKFDGKDYPSISMLDGKVVAGNPNMVSAKKIDDYTFELTYKAKGKVMFTVKNVVAKNGKTRTETQTAYIAQGETRTRTRLMEKQ